MNADRSSLDQSDFRCWIDLFVRVGVRYCVAGLKTSSIRVIGDAEIMRSTCSISDCKGRCPSVALDGARHQRLEERHALLDHRVVPPLLIDTGADRACSSRALADFDPWAGPRITRLPLLKRVDFGGSIADLV